MKRCPKRHKLNVTLVERSVRADKTQRFLNIDDLLVIVHLQ